MAVGRPRRAGASPAARAREGAKAARSEPARITGAEALARRLAAHGVRRVFVAPGVAVAPTIAACDAAGIECVAAPNESAAGHAALAAARLSDAAAVVLVGAGPGAIAALPIVASSFYDSIPLVLVSGQVGTADLLSRPHVRQRAFQEAPTPDLARPIAKACLRPMLADAVAPAFERAWRIAREGRPGPVLLDLPIDVQRGVIDDDEDDDDTKPPAAPPVDVARVESLADMLRQAGRPVLLAGQGVLLAHAGERLREIAEMLGAPVATTLLGVGAIPGDHPLCLGYAGRTGTAWANRALQTADLVVAVGARLDESQTGTRSDDFVPRGRVVRIDVDRHELEQSRVHAYLCIQGDAAEVLDALRSCLSPVSDDPLGAWRDQIARWRRELPLDPRRPAQGVPPVELLRALDRATTAAPLMVVTSVGLHQVWAARHLTFDHPQRVLLTPGGHATPASAVPAAIGACLARPRERVLCVIGDGCLARSLSELASVAAGGHDVKLVLLDNRRLAIVSQLEGERAVAGPGEWDPLAFARALGIGAFDHPAGPVDAALLEAFLSARGPALLRVPIDSSAEVSPLLLPGQTLDAMWPWHEA